MTAKPSRPKKQEPKAPAPAAKPSRKAVDWEAIERDFRTTHLSAAEIAAKHGDRVSRQAIHKRAKDKGWQRDLTDAVRQATKAKLVEAEVQRRLTPQVDKAVDNEVDRRLASTTDRVLVEAEIGAEVVMRHREDSRQARDVMLAMLGELKAATLFPDDLAALLDKASQGIESPEALDGLRAELSKHLSLRNRVASAQKLADAITKVQLLERKAYDLDAPEDAGKKGGPITKHELTDEELAAIAAGSSR